MNEINKLILGDKGRHRKKKKKNPNRQMAASALGKLCSGIWKVTFT